MVLVTTLDHQHHLSPTIPSSSSSSIPSEKVTYAAQRLPSEVLLHISNHLFTETDIGTILNLSFTSRSQRILLAPRIWSKIWITTPDHLPRLEAILEFYRSHHRENGQHASVASHEKLVTSLEPPTSLIRSIVVRLPERYQNFDQSPLLKILSDAPISGANVVELEWDAEVLPVPRIWSLLSPTLEVLRIDCKTFWGGHRDLSLLTRLKSLTMTGYESHLLPPHLPNLLRSTRLEKLCMSSSKTSILHQTDLISEGVFSNLSSLQVYPVTPEPPLQLALLSARETLTDLELNLDISPHLNNFDNLWKGLSQGRMKSLERLTVDPHPQQNTAPSFVEFLSSTPSLKLINGRKVDGLPPCGGIFDPDHRTGLFFY
ncbi:hypothetical protein IE53DRAFT_326705 [Violaceomyces palustris]|uniref:Uncharacterized protein n=1 Tax=Violaceomyces palustris TaxID=1673888 RepID=A0ACD0P2Y7_9BASI|nr:hypothetical protein IE53DRAFT_326705 [Violaceomyces palustris]